MHTLTRPRPRFALIAVLGVLVAAIWGALLPAPAAAHDVLVDSSPAAGTTVDTLPAQLVLTFSAALIHDEGTTAVEVLDPDGASVLADEPAVDGATVTVPLADESPAGEYHVVWRVVSSDSHPISGEFVFTVSTSTVTETTAPDDEVTESPEPTPAASDDPTPADSPDAEEPADEASADFSFTDALPWIIVGVVIVGLGTAAAVLLLRRNRGDDAQL